MTPPICRIPGCGKPVLRPSRGHAVPVYCSKACARQAVLLRKQAARAALTAARRAARPTVPPGICRRPGCGAQLPESRGPRPWVWCSRRCQDACRNRRALDTCQRPGCGVPLGKGRQRYCTDTCQAACAPPRERSLGPCPQCGAVGALRREGRDIYCSQRCGYYLTPGQRRAA